jgi:predicted metalloendopeptidase
VDTFIQWNAWYDEELHSIIIPPGALHFSSLHLENNDCQFYSIMGTILFHEIFHSIYRVLKNYSNINVFRSCVYNQYINDGNKWMSNVEENMADQIGFNIAFKLWNKNKLSDDNKKCFMLSFMRLFCENVDSNDGEHAMGIQRATYTIQSIGSAWHDISKCKNKPTGCL